MCAPTVEDPPVFGYCVYECITFMCPDPPTEAELLQAVEQMASGDRMGRADVNAASAKSGL
jgi:hypothetical protein